MPRIELVPALLACALALSLIGAELTTEVYDKDLDHMMYSGARLLAGELHWTVEFDDKLPVVQLLFVPAAKFHSLSIWLLMSAFSVLAGSLAAFFFVRANLRDSVEKLPAKTIENIAIYAAIAMALGYPLLWGGISHINAMAASFAMIAIALVDKAQRLLQSQSGYFSALLAAALFASLAIGIRPYFLYPLLLAGVWSGLKLKQQTASARQSPQVVTLWAMGWVAAIGIFGLIANAAPYLLTDNLDALFAGLAMLSQKLNPQTSSSILAAQADFLYLWTALLGSLVLYHFRWGLPRKAWLDVIYLLAISPGLLELAILSRHYWAHYPQMFVPFICLGGAIISAHYFARIRPTSRVSIQPLLVLSSLIGILLLTILNLPQKALGPSNHPQQSTAKAFRQFLETRPVEKRDFLSPTSMYLHWQLNEPRHGFPHAANTGHIVDRGWWNEAQTPRHFQLPKTLQGYCTLLEDKGPSLIIETSGSSLIACFENNPDSLYTPVNLDKFNALSKVLILQRQT